MAREVMPDLFAEDDAPEPSGKTCQRCPRPATTRIVYGGWRWHYEILTCLWCEEGVIDRLQELDARITEIIDI